jgi:hypothetical protein
MRSALFTAWRHRYVILCPDGCSWFLAARFSSNQGMGDGERGRMVARLSTCIRSGSGQSVIIVVMVALVSTTHEYTKCEHSCMNVRISCFVSIVRKGKYHLVVVVLRNHERQQPAAFTPPCHPPPMFASNLTCHCDQPIRQYY